jgi:hypothetical protein
MAKLDTGFTLRFAAAASALTLTTSRKLIRNFSYYRSDEPDTIYSTDLVLLCRKIRKKSSSLYNLMEHDPESSPFFVSLAGEINELLEELHRSLLFFEGDRISEIIPIIDQQRDFWSGLTNTDFYSETLLKALETEIPDALQETETKLLLLPESASI